MARLEGQLQISVTEARKSTAELQSVLRNNDEALRNLKEENIRLKEKCEQFQSQLHGVRDMIDTLL